MLGATSQSKVPWAITLGSLLALIAGSALLSAGSALAPCELKARGLAGFGYRDITTTDKDTLRLPSAGGIIISQIVPGSPAERAGLKVGDVVKKCDDREVLDGSGLASITRLYYAGDKITVSLVRGGKALADTLVLGTFPQETGDDLDVEYTCFKSGDVRLRAVVTSPSGSAGQRLPALLLVSALGSPRLTALPYYDMGREIANAVSRSGFRVLRFELRGYGDSEGADYRTTDFDTEVGDNLAALDYLATREDVDPARVFVMGHSTGGMIASVLAGKRETAGLITSCTIGRTFYERSLETLRLQSSFAGDSAAVTDIKLKEYLDLMTSAARGDSTAAILRRNPALAKYVNSSGRIMDDRSVNYWREQLNLNLPEVYGAVTEPVLIVYCSSDFLTQLACHETIRDVIVASGNRDITLEVVSGTDHAYAFAKDKRESYDNYKTRDFKGNPEPIRRVTEWLARHRD
ncbi:MAG: alpha/beta fold hydrolase [Candidatus Eisenbacteria bacterium]